MVLRRIGVALATFGLLFLFVGTLPASADATCTQKVVDTTAKSLLDTKQVEAAISQLDSIGADVYVRSFEKTPNGSSDTYYRDAYGQCSNWQSPDGKTPKSNLIVVTFGMDHTSGIYYGSSWHQLDQKYSSIRANSLNANLKSGNYTAAITATLTQLGDAIKTPASSSQGSGSAVDAGAIGLVVLYIVGAVALLALLIFVGYRLIRAYGVRKIMKDMIQRAKRQAVDTKQETTELYTRLMNGPDSKTQSQSLELQTLAVPTAETRKFEVRFKEIQRQLTQAVTDYTELNAAHTDLATKSHSLKEWSDIHVNYRSVRTALESADRKSVELWKELDDLNQQLTPEGRQERLAQLQVELDNDSRLLATFSAFDTTRYKQRLDKLSSQVQSLSTADNTDDSWTAYQTIQRLFADEETLASDLRGLEACQQEIHTAPVELKSKLERTKRLVETSKLSNSTAKKYTRQLDSLEQSIAEFGGDPSRSVDKVRSHKDSLHKSLDNVASACRNEHHKRNSSTGSYGRRSDRSNNSFGDAMLGGYIGATLGNNDTPRHTSNDTPSPSFGGGGGGDWGGGGGDFGGGGGGGW